MCFLKDLITYCEREGIPFTVFYTFEDIHMTIKDIVYAHPPFFLPFKLGTA